MRRLGFVLALVLCITALVLAAAALDFHRRLQSSRVAGPAPATAVIFTGQFNRIEHGLQRLEEGTIQTLFISGVNSGAGLSVSRFPEQFSLSGEMESALEDGRIILAPHAGNTMENAAETACWHHERAPDGALLLITSRSHMPRASLALEASLPAIRIVRQTVPDTPERSVWSAEFAPYLATQLHIVVSRLPLWQIDDSARVMCPR